MGSIKDKFASFKATPRIYLFFPAIVLKLVASALTAVAYVQHESHLWIIGMTVFFIWIALLIFIALPRTDEWLKLFEKQLRSAALVLIVLLSITGLLELAGIFGIGLTNVNINIFGKDTAQMLSALNHSFAYNDATALCHQAADNARLGLNPYAEANIVTANLRFGNPFDKTTPLRAGRFVDDFPYPDMDKLDAVWEEAAQHPESIPPELESRLNYPAGCFLIPLPFLLLGIPDFRLIYLVLVIPAVVYAVIKAPERLRWWMLAGVLCSVEILNSIASGETGILSIPFLLLAWLLWRRNLWLSAICLGLAVAGKQIAWFFAPFLLILVLRELGVKRAALAAGIAVSVFFIINLPFMWQNPGLWADSVMAPMSHDIFPLGVGIVAMVSGAYWHMDNSLLFLFFEAASGVVCLVTYYLACRRAPYLALVLAVVPLLFAWRSLWSYFFYFDVVLFIVVIINEYGNVATLQSAPKLVGYWSEIRG